MTNQDPKTDARDDLAEDRAGVDPSNSRTAEGMPVENPGDVVPDATELQKQLNDGNDRALRSHAELENFRKRARREIEDERRYAALSVINDLLGVLDNLERAVAAAGQTESSAGLLDGVKMVAQQFNTVLQQHHCRRIETIGRPFDPNLHEAAGQEPSTDIPAGHVSRELRSGYQLHDRVVRPAQVLVAVAPREKRAETDS